MKRELAEKALDRAFEKQIDRLFRRLTSTFDGSANAIAAAEKDFADGFSFSVREHGYAQGVIAETFKD